MDNVRILINRTEVGYYDIESTGLLFSWQAKLIDEINTFETTVSRTLTLPLTKALKIILRNPECIDVVNSVSSREYFTIEIYWNETIAIEGYMKSPKIVIMENDEYIEFTVEPKEKDWVTQFRNFKLTDLDYTTTPDQSHDLTYSNITTSETSSPTREYVYAPFDIAEIGRLLVLWVEQSGAFTNYYYYGEPVVAGGGTFVGNTYGFENSELYANNVTFTDVPDAVWNPRNVFIAQITGIGATQYYDQWGYIWVQDINYWQVADFYPSISHAGIIRRCFEKIGYQSTLIDSELWIDDKYNFVHNIEQLNRLEALRTVNKFKVLVYDIGFAALSSFPFSTFTYIVPFRKIDIDGFKPTAQYDDLNSDDYASVELGTNVSEFTANETCILRFAWEYHLGLTLSSASCYLYGIIKQYNSSGTLIKTLADNTIFYGTASNMEISGTITTHYTLMNSGDYIVAYITKSATANLDELTIYSGNTFESILFEGGNFKDKPILLNEYLPDVSAYDYIKDISFINNLEFYTDEKRKHVYLVPDVHKANGDKVDFTQKLDFQQGVELEEIGVNFPKKMYFNWLADDNDWCIKFIEKIMKDRLSTNPNADEAVLAGRFGYGLITNTNLFAEEIVGYSCSIYAASLDKFEVNNSINFNTCEAKGEETYDQVPTWKRVDYEPRYIRIIFDEVLEGNGINGMADVVYSIEGNPNHESYPRIEFQKPLHFGDLTGETYGLINTKYWKFRRQVLYGWILRAMFHLKEIDVITFALQPDSANKFRSDYLLSVKGITTQGEIQKITDFQPVGEQTTQIEFIIYRDGT